MAQNQDGIANWWLMTVLFIVHKKSLEYYIN